MIRRAWALVLFTLLVGACGDDGPSQTAATTATPGTAASAITTTTAAVEVDSGPEYFASPSGNIGCFLRDDGVRCDIRDRTWKPPPRPASCDLDYGQGISLDDTGAQFVCAGDTALGGPGTLAYGSTAQRGRFKCSSATDGMTCTDVRTQHGFMLATTSYKIF